MISTVQFGGFHGHQGALAAFEEGLLDHYFTTHPQPVSFSQKSLSDLSGVTLGSRALGRLERTFSYLNRGASGYLRNKEKDLFDRIVSDRLGRSSEIVHFYSSEPRTWDRSAQIGARRIFDFGIMHPEEVSRLVSEEAATWGISDSYSRVSEQALRQLHEADRIVVPSALVRGSLKENGVPSESIRLIHYGVDSFFFQTIDSKKASSRRTLRVATAGYLGLRKGVLHIFDAVSRLGRAKDKVELLLFGDWQPNVRERAFRFGITPTFEGGVAQDELRRWYLDADIFVLPSLAEGQSRAVLEAMASGLPVIVSSHSGFEGLVRDGVDGFIVPPADGHALSQALERFLENPTLIRKMGREARNTAASMPWSRYRDGLKAVFRELSQ